MSDPPLESLVPHIFLPPQLPQAGQSDSDELATIKLLSDRLFQSAQAYKNYAPAAETNLWTIVTRMLRRVCNLASKPLTASRLKRTLRELADGDVLPLHIRAQNAAVVIRKDSRGAIFEVFEAATTNEAVYSTAGKLLIDFPGPAVHVPQATFGLAAFQEQTALFLSGMDSDVLDDAVAETTKAGSTVQEVRDTTDPRYISELFVGILHGCNGATNADVRRVTKRVADEVMWSSAYKPWRRLPLWLILRVVLQTTIPDNAQYKAFMLFFMSGLLGSCVKRGLPSDVLHAVRAKVARRFAKLGESNCPEFVVDIVRESVQSTEALLKQRWEAVQLAQARQATWVPPSDSDLRASTRLSLDHALGHLTSVLHRDEIEHSVPTFIPSHSPRHKGEHDFKTFHDGHLTSALRKDTPTLVLADFEASVRTNLGAWVDRRIFSSALRTAACVSLFSCFQQYQEAAGTHYSKHNPEDQSVAVLTLLNLWVGIDRLALAEHPTMSDFSPEIPVTYLEPLVLRDENNIRLAHDVEQYIRERTTRARPHAISVFHASSDPSSLPLRLYAQNPRFAALKERIEHEAHTARDEKKVELERLNDRHNTLTQQAAGLKHEYVQQQVKRRRRWVTEQVHSHSCARCSLARQAEALSIGVHEWPLPSKDDTAKLVVFELACPQVYSLWREATYAVLTSVGRIETTNERALIYARLATYPGLARYITARTSRLTLGSKTKSFLSSHYKTASIPTYDSKICVNNGLTFATLDSNIDVWTATIPFSTSSVAKLCAPIIPADSDYHHLQFALERTDHTSNQILADVASCPKELSLHEHIAFASMRSGGRLQWLNLARELRARVLAFGAPEVHHLVTQAIWQIGPLSGNQREWHADLEDSAFCLTVLAELLAVLEGVGENWQEIWTVQTSIMVASRILGACGDAVVRPKAVSVLRKARSTAAVFRDKLQERLQHTKASSLDAIQRLVCEAAATVASTYDVLEEHVGELLRSPGDVFELVRSIILVQENTPSDTESMPLHTQFLVRRHDRTLLKVEDRLRLCIAANPEGLDRAICSLWSIYRSDGSAWSVSVSPNERQLFRVLQLSEATQVVHLNLLNGLLLVDGKPLGRLPTDITTHATFRRVFGQAILDVVPASDRHMQYEARSAFHGYSISFSLRSGEDLVVRAKSVKGGPDLPTLQLIPHSTFAGDLPHALVEDYVHWIDLESGHVEFRPLDSRWMQDVDNWTLVGLRQDQPSLRRGISETHLVDSRSSTFTVLCMCLNALELSQFILATFDGQLLLADLPRFRLLFSMNGDGELESETFRDMVVDEDQASHRTMFGLKNQLILRAKNVDAQTLPRSRKVIIPDGNVSFVRTPHHVQVNVEHQSHATRLTFHEFLVDDDLGCLTGASSTAARLFQTLLHAVTSSCLPDPLTGHTGTEHALKMLDGAQMLSFRSLSSRDSELLGAIASLSPSRTFYPAHLRVMQQVDWVSLSPLSQHAGFKTGVDRIVAYAHSLEAFHEHIRSESAPSREAPSPVVEETSLSLRSVYRSSALYPPDTPTCGQSVRIQDDLVHKGRHPLDAEARALAEFQVATFSRSIQAPTSSLSYSDHDVLAMLVELDTISALGASPLTMTYSPMWLGPDIGLHWFSLYRSCTLYHDGPHGLNRHRLTFSMCAFVYAEPDARSTAMLLVALALNGSLSSEVDPWASLITPTLQLCDGFAPESSVVSDQIRGYTRNFEDSPAEELQQEWDESSQDFEQRQDLYFEDGIEQAVDQLTTHYMSQWSGTVQGPVRSLGSTVEAWIDDGEDLRQTVQEYFQSCSNNAKFAAHIHRVQTILRSASNQLHHSAPLVALLPPLAPVANDLHSPSESLVDIMKRVAPPSLPAAPFSPCERLASSTIQQPAFSHGSRSSSNEVQGLLSSFGNVQSSGILRTYLSALEKSVEHWNLTARSSSTSTTHPPTLHALRETRDALQRHMQSCFDDLRQALLPSSPNGQQLESSGLWSRVTPSTLLRTLSQDQRDHLPQAWTRALMLYGRAFMAYQQLQRMLESFLRGRVEDVRKELENTTLEEAISVEDTPDWTLIQIESNFLSRPLQRSIAREMIDPVSEQNSLLQLNMGEGKSSVIVPFTVTALANKNALVRVIVLKALSGQMFDLLVDRVGGLARRRVFYLPFSRGVSVSSELVLRMKNLYNECIQAGGILVIQPEHILSFKLMGLDLLTSDNSSRHIEGVADNERLDIARFLCDLQRWVTHASRDVLDESDELLHARYQLIYTVDLQQPVEDHPYRWTTAIQALSVLQDCVAEIRHQHPDTISYHADSTSHFPHIRLLTSDADDALKTSVVSRILSGAIPNLLFSTLPAQTQTYIADFIGSADLSEETYEHVSSALAGSRVWSGVLLLRGLLATGRGVSWYALKERRWRVDFGLDPSRTQLAVPYRAKDVPSLKAEFGHPDVAIVLTCLAYYYSGLSIDQVERCFTRLLKMDDPQQEYSVWVSVGAEDVPANVRDLAGINLEDRELVENTLTHAFAFNRAVVNFFLSHIVFPREAKVFPRKLCTSPWDLVEHKPQVTTGFSGTKDNRFLLPTSVLQTDLPEQRGTDAMVLSYMLQRENNYALYTEAPSGAAYLRFIVSQPEQIRVLLDVGAQMLDMRNQDLVQHWLSLCDQEVQAGVFFTDADELTVITRDGVVEPLRSSPFSEQLDKCIVYLDDAHTRGTDLKLPLWYRAAITLGQKVTKDRIVQGAMRMRKLGFGQSVLLIAPPEVDRTIRRVLTLDDNIDVKVAHVLSWSMLETCADIERHIPHWAEQGVDYHMRSNAGRAYDETGDLDALQYGWLRPEAKTLEQMYGMQSSSQQNHQLWRSVQEHEDLAGHLARIGVTSIGNARLSEEQEREVVLEVERERQVQRPPKVDPAPHHLRQDVLALVQSGRMPSRSPHFITLFSPIWRVGDAWDARLLATRDFADTVAAANPHSLHEYLRPVAWVLSVNVEQQPANVLLVVISPYEANELLPLLRTAASGIRLHIFTPRITNSMVSMSDLCFHAIPPLPSTDWSPPPLLRSLLSLFAGQLWLDDHGSYKELCAFLGLYMGCSAEDIRDLQEGDHIGSDGFVRPRARHLVSTPSDFQRSPVERLLELFGLRRKGITYLKTHMGQILSARELSETEWQVREDAV